MEGDERVGVEVRAAAHCLGKIRCGVGRAHVQQLALHVDRHGRPDRAASERKLRVLLPGLRSRFARRGNDVEPPDPLTVVHAIGRDPAADAVLPHRRAQEDERVVREWRRRERLALGGIARSPRPEEGAHLAVERDDIAVRGAAKDASAKHGDAAVVAADLGGDRRPGVLPLLAAAGCVERDGRERRRDEHDAVVHDRAGLEIRLLAHLVDAGRAELRRVGGVDLREWGVARAGEIAGMGQPVAAAGRRGAQLGERRARGARGNAALTAHEVGGRAPRASCCRARWRLEVHEGEACAIGDERRVARHIAVALEHVGEHGHVVCSGQRVARVLGHRVPRDGVQLLERPLGARPLLQEGAASEWRGQPVVEPRAVAKRARSGIHPAAAVGLRARERGVLRAGHHERGDEGDKLRQCRGLPE